MKRTSSRTGDHQTINEHGETERLGHIDGVTTSPPRNEADKKAAALQQALFRLYDQDNQPDIVYTEDGPQYGTTFHDAEDPRLAAEIAAAEKRLDDHLITHRAQLGDLERWKPDYAAIDDRADSRPSPADHDSETSIVTAPCDLYERMLSASDQLTGVQAAFHELHREYQALRDNPADLDTDRLGASLDPQTAAMLIVDDLARLGRDLNAVQFALAQTGRRYASRLKLTEHTAAQLARLDSDPPL